MGAVDQPLVLRAPMAHVSIERKYMETVRFDQLDLYPQVLRAIAEMGFEEATPIQSLSLIHILFMAIGLPMECAVCLLYTIFYTQKWRIV